MTSPEVRWITRLDEAPASAVSVPPLVWIVRHVEAAGWPLPPAEAADLADAACAKRDGGAGRLLRRRLLRALAARVFDLHPAAVRFTRDVQGRPGLAEPAAFISTAGCAGGGGTVSAVALSPVPIGVDLEPVDGGEDLARWTLAEAYLKALGCGLTVPPEHVRVEPDGLRRAGWRLAGPDAPEGVGEQVILSDVTCAAAMLPPLEARKTRPAP